MDLGSRRIASACGKGCLGWQGALASVMELQSLVQVWSGEFPAALVHVHAEVGLGVMSQCRQF